MKRLKKNVVMKVKILLERDRRKGERIGVYKNFIIFIFRTGFYLKSVVKT